VACYLPESSAAAALIAVEAAEVAEAAAEETEAVRNLVVTKAVRKSAAGWAEA
jgi:hypothetical protein